MKHLAICINTKQGRCGFVISASTWQICEDTANNHSDRVGYMGCESFTQAVDEAMKMERGEYKVDLSKYRVIRRSIPQLP
jgi:hypothetical protein